MSEKFKMMADAWRDNMAFEGKKRIGCRMCDDE